jgi:prepilin-type N-terminal cleavage/methylation domain-containing protein
MINHKHFLPKGFTLVEMLIVLCVIGILTTIVTIGYAGYRDNAVKAQISTTADAYVKSLKTYALEYNSFPKVSTCLPSGAKCCASNVADLPAVYCGTNAEAAGVHNWATDSTDVKITKYINNQAPTFPVVNTFPDCVAGIMDVGSPCKPTASIPVVGPAYISNQTGSKYTSDEPSLAGKGFLIYYIGPTYPCGSANVMTLSGNKLVFNSGATYTRSTSAYRECIIGT